MVKVTRIKRSYANCYLLEGEGGAILVDSCNVKDGPDILRAVTGKNVKLILLTHCHFDHVSSAAYLAKRLGVPIAMSEKDVPLIGHGTDSHLQADNPLGKIMGSNPISVATLGMQLCPLYASVAQLVEQRTENPRVTGSIPVEGTIRGHSSSGRAPPCQGGGSEFEPRCPLQLK